MKTIEELEELEELAATSSVVDFRRVRMLPRSVPFLQFERGDEEIFLWYCVSLL